MRFYEFESKQLFGKHGIPLPKGSRIAHSREEAMAIAAEIAGPVVLKSQVLTGGRMKAGGVLFADYPAEAGAAAEKILGLTINGHKPRGVLVEGRAPVAQEYYVGFAQDEWRASEKVTLNFGLRYDYYTVMKEVDNRIVKFNIDTGLIDPDTTPPRVVASSPAAESRGVLPNAPIQLTFSEPMDRAATELAYGSADMPRQSATFSWSEDGTVLVIQEPTVNLGNLETSGVDVGFKYRLRTDSAGDFQFSLDRQ